MKVRVLLLAQLREIFGKDEWIVQVREGTTVEELACELIQKSGHVLLARIPLLYAVNEQFESGRKKLKDRDVVALMPPVSGG